MITDTITSRGSLYEAKLTIVSAIVASFQIWGAWLSAKHSSRAFYVCFFMVSWHRVTGFPPGRSRICFYRTKQDKRDEVLLHATEEDIVFEHYEYRQEKYFFSMAIVACGCHSVIVT
jgi:hypothetical protein